MLVVENVEVDLEIGLEVADVLVVEDLVLCELFVEVVVTLLINATKLWISNRISNL